MTDLDVNSNGSRIKQAVYTAVINIYDKDKAAEAVSAIGSMLRDGSFSMIPFVNMLADMWALDEDAKSTLRMDLYRNILPGSKLEKIPSELEPQEEDDDSSGMSGDDFKDCQKVFTLLLNSLCGLVREKNKGEYDDFKEIFNTEVEELSLSGTATQELSRWINEQDQINLGSELKEQDMAMVIHAAYNAVSMAVSPVMADKILGAAINKCESHPSANRFSPKNFL